MNASCWPPSRFATDDRGRRPERDQNPRWRRREWLRSVARASLSASIAGLLSGCVGRSGDPQVVAYVALDREFSAKWLERFQHDELVDVIAKWDVESTKTVGLVNAILLERDRPLCDLFWNNEILHTLRLQRAGVLLPYESPTGKAYPVSFRDPAGAWHGFAARARVLVVHNERVPPGEEPRSVESLADPRWKGNAGIAKPLFGTTASHAAVLFARWGRVRSESFFRAVHENARTMSGNKQVATSVGRGQLAWGLTDTDDAIAEIEAGSPVRIVYPDQASDQEGTLLIPNTLAIIRNCRNPERAKRLVDYLLRPEVERDLALGESAQVPLHPAVKERPRVIGDPAPRWMDVDFAAAADAWDDASRWLKQLYLS